MIVHLLHEGVREERHLRAVLMPDLGTVEIEIRERGAEIGGARRGVSPAIEVKASELALGARILAQARASGRAAFDTIDDIARPRDAFLRLRADPSSVTLVLRVVDRGRPRSRCADWPDAPGSLCVLEDDWLTLLALARPLAAAAVEPHSGGADRAAPAAAHASAADPLPRPVATCPGAALTLAQDGGLDVEQPEGGDAIGGLGLEAAA